MKQCPTCNELKELTEFSRDNSRKGGVRSACKKCINKYNLKHRHTKLGFVARIYSQQRSSAKSRGHASPDYSKQELENWIFSRPNFDELYSSWVKSGYKKILRPSCDRLDDYKSYTLGNLRLVTWLVNDKKGHADIKNGINKNQLKPVIQMDLRGDFIAEHYSLRQASRNTGCAPGNISKCCHGEHKNCGGYLWEFR